MKNKIKSLTPYICLAGIALCLTACGPKETEDSSTPTTAVNQLDSIQLLESQPTDALPVKAAREQLKPGDTAVVLGQIGGVNEPFTTGYAGFVLSDTDIEFCDEMGDDHCQTPWDACCEDPDKLKASRASVQFVDTEGEPLNVGLKSFAGLQELSYVVVTGTVAETSTPENLIIDASGLYVKN